MSAADLVEQAVGGRVLVFGSLPPWGRDLDLLVRGTEQLRIQDALDEAGYESHGQTRVRFADCSASVVDLVPAASWALPSEELDRLFEEARPLPGYHRLVRPAPHHVLLILARRLAYSDGRLDAARRARLEQALTEDPRAWTIAEHRAAAWGASAALALLAEARYRKGRIPRRRQASAVRELRAVGEGRRPSLAGTAYRQSRRQPRGRVIALSGLDGAGKSLQAGALAAALEQLGFEPLTRWTRVSNNPSLRAISAPVVWLLLALRARAAEAPVAADVDSSRLATSSQRVRQRSRTLTAGWATVVATLNAVSQRRATVKHLRRGRQVICDRWTLDSAVHLRYRYGESRRFRMQVTLIRWISPRPVVSFFLDVSPEVAHARKGEFSIEQLGRHARLYREEYLRAGALRVDGELPPEEICAQIASTTLEALEQHVSGRRRLLGRLHRASVRARSVVHHARQRTGPGGRDGRRAL